MKNLTKAERAELERRRDEIRFVMSDRRGRNVVWWLLSRAGLHRSSFSADAATTAFQEGRRDIGLAVFDRLMDADANAYIRLLQEHQPPEPQTATENDDDRHGFDDARG